VHVFDLRAKMSSSQPVVAHRTRDLLLKHLRHRQHAYFRPEDDIYPLWQMVLAGHGPAHERDTCGVRAAFTTTPSLFFTKVTAELLTIL